VIGPEELWNKYLEEMKNVNGRPLEMPKKQHELIRHGFYEGVRSSMKVLLDEVNGSWDRLVSDYESTMYPK
jgi:hypothetical protein